MPGCTDWLAEISADLREAVAHPKRVPDDALYKFTAKSYTFTLLYGEVTAKVSDKSCRVAVMEFGLGPPNFILISVITVDLYRTFF